MVCVCYCILWFYIWFCFHLQVGLQKELDQYQLKMLTQETETTAVRMLFVSITIKL